MPGPPKRRVLLAVPILTVAPATFPELAHAGKQTDETFSGGAVELPRMASIPDLIRLVGLQGWLRFGAGEGRVLDGDLWYVGPTSYGDVQEGIISFCVKPEDANVPIRVGPGGS